MLLHVGGMLLCSISSVIIFLHTDFNYEWLRLRDRNIHVGLTTGASGQQGILSSRHLMAPLLDFQGPTYGMSYAKFCIINRVFENSHSSLLSLFQKI